jgi:hypothetical protein
MLKKELTDRQAITMLLVAAAIVGGNRDEDVVKHCSVLADQIINLEKQT